MATQVKRDLELSRHVEWVAQEIYLSVDVTGRPWVEVSGFDREPYRRAARIAIRSFSWPARQVAVSKAAGVLIGSGVLNYGRVAQEIIDTYHARLADGPYPDERVSPGEHAAYARGIARDDEDDCA